MKKLSLVLLFFLSLLQANDKAREYSSNETCKSCHTQIYNEFKGAMHANSIPQKDPIHNAIWSKHPKNKKAKRYGCGKCHTPAANNLDDMKTKGHKALPDINNQTHTDGISCAYCHRIKSIKHNPVSNTNIISDKPKSYFGTRIDHIKSPYHEIVTDNNEHMKNGNVCIGCHSHKMNKHKLNVCSTNIDNSMDKANCVSCHMPQVKGSVSNLKERKTHAFHGFTGSHFNAKMLAKYVDINLEKDKNNFKVSIKNHTSHALLLHPLRMAVLSVTVNRNGKKITLPKQTFIRVLGHNKKPAMPWIADVVLKNTMIQARENRVIKYDFKLQDGDIVDVTLGWYLVNPKVVNKLGLSNEEIATKFIKFKEARFAF